MLKTYYNPDKSIFEIGIDEAGRGPLLGRVYAAAVVLPKDETFNHKDMKDSKRFSSSKKIKEIEEYIKQNAIAWAVEYEDEQKIDEINILQSTFSCMHKCIKKVREQLSDKFNKNDKNDKNDKDDKNKISKFMQNKNPNVFASFKKYNNNNNNNNNKDGIVGAASAASAASAAGKDEPIKPNEHTLTDFCTIRNSGKFYNFTFLTSNNNKGNNHKAKNIKNVSFSQFKNKGNHCVT